MYCCEGDGKMNIMRNLLIIITILCVCFNWCFVEGAEKRESGKIDSYTIQVSSLFPSSSCVPSSKASNTKSSLRVVHMHGACSHLSKNKEAKIDHDEILRRGQARVDSIHSKFSKKNADRFTQSKSTQLPAKSGRTIGSGNYIVTVGIGTPKHDLSLVFDTGSDLSWTQCEPCTVPACYLQKEPIFNPSSSSSYHKVSCSSPMCRDHARCSADSNCVYRIDYGDKSYSQGFFATEKFTLTNSDVFDGVYFGCGVNNRGIFNGSAGILGLGRSKISFPSQTATTYNNIFSYCLPSTSSSTGHLTFGSSGISGSVKFTPISSSAGSDHYGIDIIGITIGDKKLEFTSTNGAIIDSGTVITRLPPTVYAELRSVFKEKMSNYKTTSGHLILDTCYDFTGLQLDTVTLPKVAFSFGGGAVVELARIGILYPFTMSQVCLAFAGKDDDLPTIFGNVQQKTIEIVHDAAGGRVGFAPNGCS